MIINNHDYFRHIVVITHRIELGTILFGIKLNFYTYIHKSEDNTQHNQNKDQDSTNFFDNKRNQVKIRKQSNRDDD